MSYACKGWVVGVHAYTKVTLNVCKMKRHHEFDDETRKRVEYEHREVIDLTNDDLDGSNPVPYGTGGTVHVLDDLDDFGMDNLDEEFFKSIDIVESKYIATQNFNLDNTINDVNTLQNGSGGSVDEQLNQLKNDLQIKTGEISFLRKNESKVWDSIKAQCSFV